MLGPRACLEAGDDDALSSESGTTKQMLTVAFSWSPDASLSPICILFKRTLKDHSIRHLNSFFGFFLLWGEGSHSIAQPDLESVSVL